jgi:hypothetical protein
MELIVKNYLFQFEKKYARIDQHQRHYQRQQQKQQQQQLMFLFSQRNWS